MWIETADPQYDAASAIQKHDNKFKAVMGYTIKLPGLDEETYSQAYQVGNYDIIKGTSDGVCSERHLELNLKAQQYAEAYNEVILLKIKLN